MPPRFGGGWAARNANRDYTLLSGDGDSPRPVPARRLLTLVRGEGGTLALATLALLVASVSQVAFPKLAGDLIDLAVHGGGGGGGHEEERVNAILAQVCALSRLF